MGISVEGTSTCTCVWLLPACTVQQQNCECSLALAASVLANHRALFAAACRPQLQASLKRRFSGAAKHARHLNVVPYTTVLTPTVLHIISQLLKNVNRISIVHEADGWSFNSNGTCPFLRILQNLSILSCVLLKHQWPGSVANFG